MNWKKLIIFVWFLLVSGCADLGPRLYPVSGKVQISGQDIGVLEGSAIEVVSEADNNIRAAGTINADGSFILETLQMGRMQKGAREGDFKARIVISDDDKAKLRLANKAVQKKYLDFESSGWKVKVPVSSDVLLNLDAK
ncbi:MAG: hypothetical protein WCN64_06280 [Planctomycetota bacterium]